MGNDGEYQQHVIFLSGMIVLTLEGKRYCFLNPCYFVSTPWKRFSHGLMLYELTLMVLKLGKSSGCFIFLLYLYSALSLVCRLPQVSGTDAERRISPQITQLLSQCNHQCLKQH